MKKILKKILKKKKHRRNSSSSTPLKPTNSQEDSVDSHVSAVGCSNNSLVQNSINSQTEDPRHRDLHSGPQISVQSSLQSGVQPSLRSLDQETVQRVAELLGVNPDCLSVSSQANPALFKHTVVLLIQESVQKHLPEPPPDLESGLQRHLQAMQRVVLQELVKLSPLLKVYGLMGKLTESYHRGIFKQMKKLLRRASSTRTCLQLLRWALSTYFSQELILNPEIQGPDLIRHLDVVLLSDWTQQAQGRLLSLLKTDISSQLNNILAYERQHQPCQNEEDYVRTYVDVVKCIDAAPTEAQKFSSELSLKVTQVCLNQLQMFVNSYKTQWFEWLAILTKTKMADKEMPQFFRTLKTCQELKTYITQTKHRWMEVDHTTEEIVALVKEIETFTMKILLKTVAAFIESGLKEYFKSNHRHCFLMTDLETLFTPEPWLSLEEHKSAIDDCYKLIVSLYGKHLISHKLNKLRKSWSPDVANSVAEDAELIHKIMFDLCPGVEQWKFPLRFISNLLKSSDIDSIKLLAAKMLQECKEKCFTDKMPHLYDLLQWKGLPRSKIIEVLKTLEDFLDPDQVYPQPWYSICF